jgi:hypothetical protein
MWVFIAMIINIVDHVKAIFSQRGLGQRVKSTLDSSIGSFDLLDTVFQLSIPGYLPPHSLYNTADRTESGDIEFPADLLQFVSSQRPQQINRHIPRLSGKGDDAGDR